MPQTPEQDAKDDLDLKIAETYETFRDEDDGLWGQYSELNASDAADRIFDYFLRHNEVSDEIADGIFDHIYAGLMTR